LANDDQLANRILLGWGILTASSPAPIIHGALARAIAQVALAHPTMPACCTTGVKSSVNINQY
jgi:hypothetical protein